MPNRNNDNNETVVIICNETLFILIFIIIIVSWILVDLFGRALNNFTFRTLKLDPNSTAHTTIIAFTVLFLVVAVIWVLKQNNVDIQKQISAGIVPVQNNENNQPEDNSGGAVSHIEPIGFFAPI